MSAIMVRVEHGRAAGYCSSGMREWGKRQGFDFLTFVREGIPVEQMEATGDEFALRVAKIARERAGG